MEQKVITFKLQGNNINLHDMKPEDAINIIKTFVNVIKKVDKNFKINDIKSGLLTISLDMYNFIEDNDNKPENWVQKIKETVISNFFPNSKMDIEKIDIEYDNSIIDSIKNDYIDDEIVYNSTTRLRGNITDIGGKIPNINIHILINNQIIKFPIKNKETAKKWSSYLYDDVEIYAKIRKSINGKIIDGIEILRLEPIELNNKEQIYKEFYELMQKNDFSNLTDIILDMRHNDEK